MKSPSEFFKNAPNGDNIPYFWKKRGSGPWKIIGNPVYYWYFCCVLFSSAFSQTQISKQCFKKGLIIERAGRNNTVVKVMPALTIEDDLLLKGLNILKEEVKNVLK